MRCRHGRREFARPQHDGCLTLHIPTGNHIRRYFTISSTSRRSVTIRRIQNRTFQFVPPPSVALGSCTTTGGRPGCPTTTPGVLPEKPSHDTGAVYEPSPLSRTGPVSVVPGVPVTVSPSPLPGPTLLPYWSRGVTVIVPFPPATSVVTPVRDGSMPGSTCSE